MNLAAEHFELLLLIVAVVATVASRLRLPYTVGLVLAGVGLAVARFNAGMELTRTLLFTALLPPLVFEAAFYIPWRDLRRDLAVILTLATLGVALSALLTAAGMRWLVAWRWNDALLFGILIAATDPVSVIATFKQVGVEGRLRLLVDAESLLNDGTAAVAFAVMLTLATGGAAGAADIAGQLALSTAGSVFAGLAVGWGVLLLAGGTDDHLVEITLTTVAAYGSFIIAERLHLSGVLATLSAGLLIGNRGSLGAITDRGRDAVGSFWEYVAFLANSLIFILIGMRVTRHTFGRALPAAAAAIVLVLVSRAVAVYLCSLLFARSSRRVKPAHQHVLVWGGLRGALALALALGLPREVPNRDAIVTVTFAVVIFSVFVQGLTIRPLLRRLGELPRSSGPKAPARRRR